ncbi:MAG: hypothetical protein V1923_01080 [Candidatus Omnitrophota bacterium]
MNPYSSPMGYGVSSIGALVSLALTVWFVVFTVLVIKKLDRIAELLSKK